MEFLNGVRAISTPYLMYDEYYEFSQFCPTSLEVCAFARRRVSENLCHNSFAMSRESHRWFLNAFLKLLSDWKGSRNKFEASTFHCIYTRD